MIRSKTSRSNVFALIGLGFILVAAVLLSALALQKARPQVTAAGETPGFTPGASQSMPGDTNESEIPVPSAPEQPSSEDLQVSPLTHVLSAANADVAYRAVTGPCPATGGVVEVTADGGASWVPYDLAPYNTVSAVQRIFSGEDGAAGVVTLNADNCAELLLLETVSLGDTWQSNPAGTDALWMLDPADPSVLRVPNADPVQLPCVGARLAVGTETSLAVLCENTAIAISSDAGANWRMSDPFPGAAAITGIGQTFYLTQTGQADCDGTLVLALGPDFVPTVSSCVLGGGSPSETAISAAIGGSLWLWSGNQVVKSLDGGANWQ